MCMKCGAVWQTHDETAARYAPERCSCGVRLMPASSTDLGGNFSAAPCCDTCARMHGIVFPEPEVQA